MVKKKTESDFKDLLEQIKVTDSLFALVMDAGTRFQESIMLSVPINSSDHLWNFHKKKIVGIECFRRTRTYGKGVWWGDDPFEFVEPVVLMQLILGSLLNTICQLLFRPLGQTSIVGQIMAGFIAGPTALGRSKIIKEKLFPQPSRYVQETMSMCACIFIFFLAGVKMDMSMLRKSGKKEWAIGVVTFLLPLILSMPFAYTIRAFHIFGKDHYGIGPAAVLESSTSFYVVASFLHELNLLNSELGRLAMKSSMISGMLSWITLDLGMTIMQTFFMHLPGGVGVCFKLIASTVILFFTIFYTVRPIMLWMVRKTEEGRPIKKSYLIYIVIMILCCCFISEALGKRIAFTAAFVGMCVPGGPPLGSALEEKLDCFVMGVLMPLYLVMNFADVDLSRLKPNKVISLSIICVLATMGKFIGTIIPCFYCNIPLSDSIPLGLILSTLGLLDLQLFKNGQLLGFFDSNTFGILSLSIVVVTSLSAPMVRAMYNPSRKYINYKRRTLQHLKSNKELPILACVYNEDNVPALINLLEATHPDRDHPVAIYLLRLVELVGRASPILLAYQPSSKAINGSRRSGCAVINSFRIFQSNNPGVNTMQPYTSIAPYATMHDDICTLALDKRVCLIILPFHKQWQINGVVESVSRRNVNQNVLIMAPCSVGILIDRVVLSGPRSILKSWTYFRVAMIFLGGADDREALALAMRMSQHPNVKLTVIRLVPIGDLFDNTSVMERLLDEDVITEFQLATLSSKDHVVYTEEGVTDGNGTIRVVRSIDNSYDLILVGRRHDKDSPFLEGSLEWGETPDIGFIGDILTSTDFEHRVSILVVQQHNLESFPRLQHLDSV